MQVTIHVALLAQRLQTLQAKSCVMCCNDLIGLLQPPLRSIVVRTGTLLGLFQMAHDCAETTYSQTPVACSFKGCVSSPCPVKRPKLDRDKLNDCSRRAAFQEAVRTLPIPCWQAGKGLDASHLQAWQGRLCGKLEPENGQERDPFKTQKIYR